MRKLFKSRTIPLLLVFLLAFACPLQPVLASSLSNPNLELTLAMGTSEVDISNFVYDVQSKVYETYGIPSDRLRITKAGTSIVDSKSDFNWTVYDHVYSPDFPRDGSTPTDWFTTHSTNQPYFYYLEEDPQDMTKYFTDVSLEDDSMSYCNYRSKHIYPKDGGLVFVGYSVPAYKDFMVYPDQNTGAKTIQFAIDESGVSTHTLEGAGFLFNTSIADNKINGYLVFYDYYDHSTIKLYKLSNVDATAFHNEEDYQLSELAIPEIELAIPGIELLASKPSQGDAVTKNIKVQVTSNSLKFYEDGQVIYDTTGADSDVIIADTGAGGFGPLVSYNSHNCDELSYFTFKNLTMETSRDLSFLDVINQQTWNDNTKRIIVNLDNDGVPEFTNPENLSQIIAHMNTNQVNYLGWGRNNTISSAVYNQAQAEQFIGQIGNRGKFINMDDPNFDTYAEGIAAIAEYINSCLTVPPASFTPSCSSSSTPSKPLFSDMSNHWAKAEVERLGSLKLLKGYLDGTYKPDKSITRAEFATLLATVFNYAKVKPSGAPAVTFSDVPNNAWFYQAVSLLAPEGIVKGYGDNSFGPDKFITREEAAAMIARLFSKLNTQTQLAELTFKDTEQISNWARTPLGQIISFKIITGMPDGNFCPANSSTRAEAAVMMLRMLEKAKLM